MLQINGNVVFNKLDVADFVNNVFTDIASNLLKMLPLVDLKYGVDFVRFLISIMQMYQGFLTWQKSAQTEWTESFISKKKHKFRQPVIQGPYIVNSKFTAYNIFFQFTHSSKFTKWGHKKYHWVTTYS